VEGWRIRIAQFLAVAAAPGNPLVTCSETCPFRLSDSTPEDIGAKNGMCYVVRAISISRNSTRPRKDAAVASQSGSEETNLGV